MTKACIQGIKLSFFLESMISTSMLQMNILLSTPPPLPPSLLNPNNQQP